MLRRAHWPEPVNAVFNPAAVAHDGETLLLVRVEDRTGISHLGVARSADGLSGWTIEPGARAPARPGPEAERFGIEDPRITQIGDEYLIVYTGYSTDGPLIFLAATRDFRELRAAAASCCRRRTRMRRSSPRPSTAATRCCTGRCPVAPATDGGIWLSLEPRPRALGRPPAAPLRAASAATWDVAEDRPRAAAAAHARRAGSLLYHGVRGTAAGAIYRAGLALLDRERPGAGARPLAGLGVRARRRPTSASATSATSSSRAAGCSTTTATRSASTTAPPTRASAWRRRASRRLLAHLAT